MRLATLSFAVLVILAVTGTVRADQVRKLYLDKLKVAVKQPAKTGKARGSLKMQGRLESFHLPMDFHFNPAEDTVIVEVGGVTVFDGTDGGEWRRQGYRWWVNKAKGDELWKVKIEFTRGEFVIKGKRLDLTRIGGPSGVMVTVRVNDQAFSIGVDCVEKGSSWRWSAPVGGSGTNAGYNPPWYPGGDDSGGDPGTPGPVNHRILADGNTLGNNPPPPGHFPWNSGIAVKTSAQWTQEWSRMFGTSAPPTVDFSRDYVILLYERGNSISTFSVTRDASGVTVTFRAIPIPGPRSYVYRAVAVPKFTGGVTFIRL